MEHEKQETVGGGMNIEKFLSNVIDQIKEAQLKLGYAKETVRLYYPLASVNGLLETDIDSVDEMLAVLRRVFEERNCLGQMAFHVHGGRIEVSVSPEGAEYVHSHVATPHFLEDLIRLFQTRHSCSLDEICQVFSRYSMNYVCEKMPEDSDFDYVVYFEDETIDAYCYCIKMEMGHTIYHRFTKDDYKALI